MSRISYSPHMRCVLRFVNHKQLNERSFNLHAAERRQLSVFTIVLLSASLPRSTNQDAQIDQRTRFADELVLLTISVWIFLRN